MNNQDMDVNITGNNCKSIVWGNVGNINFKK